MARDLRSSSRAADPKPGDFTKFAKDAALLVTESFVPGVGEVMDLQMIKEGRAEGDDVKVAMGMIGLTLPMMAGAAWRKLGAPLFSKLAPLLRRGEITPDEAVQQMGELAKTPSVPAVDKTALDVLEDAPLNKAKQGTPPLASEELEILMDLLDSENLPNNRWDDTYSEIVRDFGIEPLKDNPELGRRFLNATKSRRERDVAKLAGIKDATASPETVRSSGPYEIDDMPESSLSDTDMLNDLYREQAPKDFDDKLKGSVGTPEVPTPALDPEADVLRHMGYVDENTAFMPTHSRYINDGPGPPPPYDPLTRGRKFSVDEQIANLRASHLDANRSKVRPETYERERGALDDQFLDIALRESPVTGTMTDKSGGNSGLALQRRLSDSKMSDDRYRDERLRINDDTAEYRRQDENSRRFNRGQHINYARNPGETAAGKIYAPKPAPLPMPPEIQALGRQESTDLTYRLWDEIDQVRKAMDANQKLVQDPARALIEQQRLNEKVKKLIRYKEQVNQHVLDINPIHDGSDGAGDWWK